MLVVGADTYVIDTVNTTTDVVTVNPAPSSEVSATGGYKGNIPSIVRRYTASITQLDQVTLDSESTMQAALILQPTHTLPQWGIMA